MYIRRKVYSVLTDDCGQERLFSTNEVYLDDCEDDRLFADVLPAAKRAAERAAEALNFTKAKNTAVNLVKNKNGLPSGDKAKRVTEALESGATKVKDAAVSNLGKLKNKNGLLSPSRFAKLKGKLLKNKKAAALGAGIGLATAAGTLASAASV